MITKYSFEYNNNSNSLIFKLIPESDYEFELAVYLFENDKRTDVSWYKKNHTYTITLSDSDIKKCISYQLGIFIKEKDNISNFKTYKINPSKLVSNLESHLNKLKDLKSISSIESYINSCICTPDFDFNDILINFIYNEYEVDNDILTDYIFSRYFMYRINVQEDWFNCSENLGIMNPMTLNNLLYLSESWYEEGKISEFTLNLVYGVKSIYLCEYSDAAYFFHKTKIPSEYFFPALINGLSTFQKYNNSTNLNRFPYEVTKKSIINSSKLTFVFSCNRVYFERFFDDALNSILLQRNDFNIAIALINTSPEDFEYIHTTLEYYRTKNNIEFSLMVLKTNKHEKTLSACARFIINDLILRETKSNTIVMDLDIFYTSKSNEMLNDIIKLESVGLSLKTNGARLIPWTAVAAAASYFPNDDISRTLASSIKEYIDFSYNEKYSWYLDQNALFHGFIVLRNRFPLVLISNIHNFASSLLTKNDNVELFQWKRSLARDGKLHN